MRDTTDVIILGGLVGDPITKKYPKLHDRINVKGIYPLARKNDAMTYLAIPKCYHRKTKLQQPP